MSRNFTQTALIVSVAISLTSCAQIGKMGGDMWGYTKSAAKFVSSPVTKLLRSAPQQAYVFEQNHAAEQARAAFLNDGKPHNDQGLVVPDLAQLPLPQSPNYQSAAHVPQYVAQARPKALTAAPRMTNDISFVKMGGGSNMHDWVMCEAEAGGFVRVVQGGYIIEPGFESCMRGKGYKPESEVADQLRL